MDEPHGELHETIQRLHDELAAADNIDGSTAEELRSAIAEIQNALSQRVERSGTEDDAESLGDEAAPGDRLSDTAREFEGSHPVLSRTIGQLVDMLGQMGI
jgi:hypothetical protein